jgi:hypothetical protein
MYGVMQGVKLMSDADANEIFYGILCPLPSSGKCTTICQVGCSSGLCLAKSDQNLGQWFVSVIWHSLWIANKLGSWE